MALACNLQCGVFTRASSTTGTRNSKISVSSAYKLPSAKSSSAYSFHSLSGRSSKFNSSARPLLSPGAKNVTTSASRPSRLAVVAPLENNLEGRVARTLKRALTINLEPTLYGSFAEIGAGQEVARMFFAAGAAAGTVAKSISAYDMTISDTFYGRCDRYVTRGRLEAMLDYEYIQTTLPLRNARGDTTCFFAFADTVVAKAFGRENECHGWMGVKWQTAPNRAPNRIMIHLRLLDPTATLQQEALGVFGVNFLHTAFFRWNDISESIEGCQEALKELMSNIGRESIEVDVIDIEGPDFPKIDNRALALQLVEVGLTDAVLFDSEGQVTIPTDYLRKKNVLVQRGNFRPPTILTEDMLMGAAEMVFCESGTDIGGDGGTCVVQSDSRVCLEITLKDLRDSGDGLDWTESKGDFLKRTSKDFLARVDTITSMGYPCLVSNYFEYFKLAAYLKRATNGAIVIAMGVPAVQQLFDPKFYTHLEGGSMENFGRLSMAGLRIFVYPTLDKVTGELITAKNLKLREEISRSQPLYDFMYSQGSIYAIDNFSREVLDKMTFADHLGATSIFQMVKKREEGWEEFVPAPVAKAIQEGDLFTER